MVKLQRIERWGFAKLNECEHIALLKWVFLMTLLKVHHKVLVSQTEEPVADL